MIEGRFNRFFGGTPENNPRANREFLPAALEIIEQPPSPIAIALSTLIGVAALSALLWAYIGQTDVVAVAYGKIQPTGRVKVIQALDTGKVKAINVSNGRRVVLGEPLVELETDEALADVTGIEAALSAFTAEAIRRDAVITSVRGVTIAPTPIAWPETIPADMREREEAAYRADVANLASQITWFDAQRQQKEAERQRLQETITAQKALIDVLKERVDMRGVLVPSGASSRSALIDANESLAYQQSILVGQEGQLRESERSIIVLNAEREKTISAFIADNVSRRVEAQRQVDDYRQRLAKARVRVEHTVLRSPVNGVVQALAATSIGQVLTPGQEVMRVVPMDGPLEIEVYLANKDIGFVHEGQTATIKLEAFPFTRYGTIDGVVTHVANDAIPEPDARQIEGDPTKPGESKQPAGAQRVQNLVFPVTLSTTADSMMIDGRRVALMPGMAVTGEIKTSQRRIIDFILAPLKEVTNESMRER
jgi:hemolysin D